MTLSSFRLLAISSLGLGISGCGIPDRLATVGVPPPLSPIKNPIKEAHYQPVTLPMPPLSTYEKRANSLWQPGSRSFFKDQRASQIGDVITVPISVNDEGTLVNKTTRKRNSSFKVTTNGLLGYQNKYKTILPKGVNAISPLDVNSAPDHEGEGDVTRSEVITTRIAALVTQVLPNKNMVIRGKQEIRVNSEVREIDISGVIRPQDILANNTITYDKIAEARITYGGRGQLSDVQQPPYGQQIMDAIWPF